MKTLTLEPDGTIDAIRPGDTAALMAGLARQVALATGYTLRSFFRMLEAYDGLVHLNAFFGDLVQQYRSGPEADCRVEGIDVLVLEKVVEMIGFPGTPRLEIYRSFVGRAGDREIPIKDYAVDLLLDMPLQLGQLKHVIFGDQIDAFAFDTVFTLFDFVEGIGWELGFHGTPRECHIRR